MSIQRRRFCQGLAAAAAVPLASWSQPVTTLLVNAATTVDGAARLAAEHFRKALARDYVVMPKLGAGGRLAVGELRRAAPDGRTLLLTTSSVLTIYPNIYKNLDYNSETDLTLVSGLSLFDVSIAVGADSPIKSVADLVKWMQGRPDGFTVGCAPGNGSANHFLAVALATHAKVPLTMVPYQGTPQGLPDLIGGRVPVFIAGTGSMTPSHRSGKLRMISTSGGQRSVLTPEVPTIRESGIDVVIENATVLVGPAGLPKEQVTVHRNALAQFLETAEAREKLALVGMQPFSRDPAAMAKWLATERQRYGALAKAGGIALQES